MNTGKIIGIVVIVVGVVGAIWGIWRMVEFLNCCCTQFFHRSPGASEFFPIIAGAIAVVAGLVICRKAK